MVDDTHLEIEAVTENRKVEKAGWQAFEPLRNPTFRSIWSASLLSNFAQLVLGVAVAWEMTRLTNSAEMVALVQTSLMLPLMLIAVPAGALADMFDKRKTAMIGLGFASLAAATLAVLSASNMTTPWTLLGFCFLIGAGVAIYGPSWMASIREQVSTGNLPSAVALASVSYNIARSIGPALGGIVLLVLGPTMVFASIAVLYIPSILAFLFWKRGQEHSPLPPERLGRAIISGFRYTIHSPAVRRVIMRAFALGFSSSSVMALTPLVARDLLHGDALVFGLLLGASGIGAVGGALLVGEVRARYTSESTIRVCTTFLAIMVLIIGLSQNLFLSGAAFIGAGAASMLSISSLNVSVQLSVPRWVTARALTWFTSSLTGGLALGAWMWGSVTADWGVGMALVASAAVVLSVNLIGLRAPVPQTSIEDVQVVGIPNEPEVSLIFTPRTGPVIIEVDYYVRPENEAAFTESMQRVQDSRLRNGAYNWTLARDVADETLWTERFKFPTWEDYERYRARFTHLDRVLRSEAEQFNTMVSETRLRRRLERPVD